MSDTSNFGFGKFVPGFDFLQSLAKGAASSIPQMPNLSSWVAPTISIEELEKRIDELKAVQFWLEQNSRALSATVQALEVQKMTLATLKGMNFSMGDVANAFKPKTAESAMGGMHKTADPYADVAGRASAHAPSSAPSSAPAPAPAPEAPAQAPTEPSASGHSEKPTPTAAPESTVVDPMQWWSALTSQFQQIAASAMKAPANQTALDTTKNMATDLATEALKTATNMASQFAAQGMQTMQEGARAATNAAQKPAARQPAQKTAAKKAAAQKPAAKQAPVKSAAKPVAKNAAKPAAKKTTARSAPRKTAR